MRATVEFGMKHGEPNWRRMSRLAYAIQHAVVLSGDV